MRATPAQPHVTRVSFYHDDEVIAAFLQWRLAGCPEIPIIDLVKEGLLMVMGETPDDARRIALRQAAWNHASARARQLLGSALRSVAEVYNEEAAVLDPARR